MVFTWTDELIEYATKRRQDGIASSKIATELGTSRSSVIGKLYRNDVKAPHRRPPSSPETQRLNTLFYRRRKKGQKVARPSPYYSVDNVKDIAPCVDDVARKSFMDLDVGDCHWPIGDPRNKDEYGYCGLPVTPGRSYCDGHSRRATSRVDVTPERVPSCRTPSPDA